jgi:hypothetical protein
MNAATVRKHLIASLGVADSSFTVKGEVSGTLRFYTVTLLDSKLYERAGEIKQAVVGLITTRGFGGGCDVLGEYGGKLA